MDEETAIAIPDKKQHKTAQAKEQAIARLENHRFKPGQSGNPKGRPKKAKELPPITRGCERFRTTKHPWSSA